MREKLWGRGESLTGFVCKRSCTGGYSHSNQSVSKAMYRKAFGVGFKMHDKMAPDTKRHSLSELPGLDFRGYLAPVGQCVRGVFTSSLTGQGFNKVVRQFAPYSYCWWVRRCFAATLGEKNKTKIQV